MAEYIERKAVEKYIESGLNNPDKSKAFGHDAIEIMAEVHYMPAADVAPVVHGEWINPKGGFWEVCQCSICGSCWPTIGDAHNYCPNCGAKMDGGQHAPR